MSAGHTPGPWEADCDDDIFTETGDIIASVYGLHDSGANARLIAAAPDLLATLKLCVPHGVCLTNKNVSDAVIVPLDVSMGDLRKIAAAIARATGAA